MRNIARMRRFKIWFMIVAEMLWNVDFHIARKSIRAEHHHRKKNPMDANDTSTQPADGRAHQDEIMFVLSHN